MGHGLFWQRPGGSNWGSQQVKDKLQSRCFSEWPRVLSSTNDKGACI